MPESKRNGVWWIWGLGIALGVAALYFPILGNGFVYDSESQVLVDPYIHNRANWAEVLTLRVLSRDVMDFNRPANLASLMMDSALWGKNPFGYHLTNLLLHVGICAMLYALLLAAKGETAPHSSHASHSSHLTIALAAGATLFFGTHPVNVEAVSEVSFREDLLVVFFSLLGLLVFHRTRGPWQWAALLCFFLAAASKETGMLTPLWLGGWLLLLRPKKPGEIQSISSIKSIEHGRNGLDGRDGLKCFNPGGSSPLLRPLLILGATTLCVGAFTAARFYLEPKNSLIFTKPPRLGGSFADTLLIQTRIWAFYFRQIVCPMDLCADYGPYSLRNFSFIASLLALLGALIFQGYFAFRNRLFAFGALTFWLFILPTSNLVPMFRPMADRFLYFPMVGVALMLAGLMVELGLNWKLIALLATASCIPLAAQTFSQEKIWHDSLALWSATRATNPASSIALNNLMDAYNKQGKPREALAALENGGLALRFVTAETFAQKAIALDALGLRGQAEAAFRQATQMEPKYARPALLVQELTWAPKDAARLQAIADRLQEGPIPLINPMPPMLSRP